MEAFRGPSGLAVARMYPLNEHRAAPVGAYLCDVERAGRHCVLTEVRAVAKGDPFVLAYLPGNTHSRGFAAYVRRFHAAFRALPALPSKRLSGAAADPDIVVRAIATPGGKHGVYYAVANTGLTPRKGVRVTLPRSARLLDAVTGKPLQATTSQTQTVLTLDLDACELRAVHAP